jgi:6-phosphogluconolactonase
LFVYVGTYTRRNSKGIYFFRFEPADGSLISEGLAAEVESPSFLALHPSRRYLYAVNESVSGTICAFSIDATTGELKLQSRVASRGSSPCHLTLDKSGKSLVAANYGDGSVAVFPILENGALGEASDFIPHSGLSVHPQRQRGPHAHQVVFSPDNKFAFVPDLGIDEIVIYRFDSARGKLAPNDPAFAKVDPGSGPRHLAFHPNGRFAYALGELGGAITAFRYDAVRGALDAFQTISTRPKNFYGDNNSAEIEIHPHGRFLYASNRGPDTIAVFQIDSVSGVLQAIYQVPTQGKTPRHFAIDPAGAFLLAANQDSDTIVTFRIDQKKRTLEPTGRVVECPTPVCITFVSPR